MFKLLSDYISQAVNWLSEPQNYGTQLEQYILSHNPTCNAQVEALERKFELMYSARNKSWMI